MPQFSSRRFANRRVSWVPFGLNQRHPNNYKDAVKALWENRDSLPYVWRILRDGCCDGCSLGTTGIHDWSMPGIHLCNLRLQLMRLNTMPAFDPQLLSDVSALEGRSERELRRLGRLGYPCVRRRGERGFRRLSWDEALEIAAAELRQIDPRKLAWYVCSRGLTNESYYAHQKVARFLGTNHIDTSARVCHGSSTAGMGSTLGVGTSTCTYADWIGTDLIVFAGSNVANNQPVAMKYLYYARKAGARMLVVNPFREPGMERYWVPSVAESALFGTRMADEFYQIRLGGDVAFFTGVLKHLAENGWMNRAFIEARTTGWDEVERHVRGLAWEALEKDAGLSAADMLRCAREFRKARNAVIVWGTGLTQHEHGSDNVRALVNLQLALGNLGRPHAGLVPMRGHSGVQGGAEMGAMPSIYVQGVPVNQENARALAGPWGFEPPSWPGLTVTDVLLAAAQGQIDGLWQSGGNFQRTLSQAEHVGQALGGLRLRIHQDIVLNPAMLIEPGGTVLLLPSRTRYEQRGGGTSTSAERRVIYTPEIPGPRPGESRDEWEVPVLVAQRVDAERAARAFPWQDTQDVRNEIERICPAYAGIAGLRHKGDNFQTRGLDPKATWRFSVLEIPDWPDGPGSFLLSTRRGRQFNSMLLEDRDPLTGAARDEIIVSPEDAARLGLRTGDAIVLANGFGEFHGRARVDGIKPGCLAGFWPEVSKLVPAWRLDASGVPDYNARVELRRLTISRVSR